MNEFNSRKQEDLFGNKEIFERIKTELNKAQKEILLAMAWFTDEELFEIMLRKASANLKISIVLSEQLDNEKLDFPALEALGASVIKIRNVGYGMMHQKFCVIDNDVVINGSYNWSTNAKKNNHENISISYDPESVKRFRNQFFKIQDRAQRLINGEAIEALEDSEMIKTEQQQIQEPEKETTLNYFNVSLKDLKNTLDRIIATEVSAFDKDLLKNIGYERALENNGDHQVLPPAMDSLYSNFINSIDVVDEKKNRVKTQLDQQSKIAIANTETNCEIEMESINDILNVRKQSTQNEITETEKNIDKLENEINNISEIKIPTIENQIKLLEQEKEILDKEFVKPPVDHFSRNLTWFIFIMLFLYIVVFYSSVAYILIFAKGDAELATRLAKPFPSPEVFDPNVFGKVVRKGVGGILFTFGFCVIPISLGLFEILSHKKKQEETDEDITPGRLAGFWKNYKSLLGILVVDILIAVQVATNKNFVEYLKGDSEDRYLSPFKVITNYDFYLVFALGSLGIYIFSKVGNKLHDLYQARNETHLQAQKKIRFRNLQKDIDGKIAEKNELLTQVNENKSLIAQARKDIKELQEKLAQAPVTASEKIASLKQKMVLFKEQVLNLTAIFSSQIDNDKLPISMSALEDRINVFLEGWSKYLHEKYAIKVAEAKTNEAILSIVTWKAQRFPNNILETANHSYN